MADHDDVSSRDAVANPPMTQDEAPTPVRVDLLAIWAKEFIAIRKEIAQAITQGFEDRVAHAAQSATLDPVPPATSAVPAHHATMRQLIAAAPRFEFPEVPIPHYVQTEDDPLRVLPGAIDETQAGLSRAFTMAIRTAAIPPKIRLPILPKYKGEGDPLDHLGSFFDALVITELSDELLCRVFVSSLSGPARGWFTRLPPGCIRNFEDLRVNFLSHYAPHKKASRKAQSLLNLQQGPHEKMRDYIIRALKEANLVEDPDPHITKVAIIRGMRPSPLKWSCEKKPPKTLNALIDKASRFIDAEETGTQPFCGNIPFEEADYAEASTPAQPSGPTQMAGAAGKKFKRAAKSAAAGQADPKRRVAEVAVDLPQFTHPLASILAAVQTKAYFQPPRPMNKFGNRDQSKHCLYHNDNGHITEDCFALKKLLAELHRRGLLNAFLAGNNDQAARTDNSPASVQTVQLGHLGIPVVRRIGVISGGASAEASRQSSLRKILSGQDISSVRTALSPISFGDDDLPTGNNFFDDAIVIEAVIADSEVARILIDTGAAVNVLMGIAGKLRLLPKNIRPAPGALIGFSGERRDAEGVVTLNVTLGDGRNSATMPIDFMVLDAPSAYNAIFGRPLLNAFCAIVSSRHLAVKFPTVRGVVTVRGSLSTARQCSINIVKGKDLEESSTPLVGVEPVEPVDCVSINNNANLSLYISSACLGESRVKLLKILKDNLNVFAWQQSDLTGVNPAISCHHLQVRPDAIPVRQRKRRYSEEQQLAIKDEVDKLLKAGSIREIQYPDWISNVVMVRKTTGKWRMCVDFKKLNDACPKDSYPLPSIDSLVDSVVGFTTMSFLDAFSGYHQIKLYEPDTAKTSFITDIGTFCYQVMPFGLKNAGATYQRLMDRIFQSQKGRNVEVYVDDILVKSVGLDGHLTALSETFATLRQAGMKLNPAKCIFGARSGKFLGYIVSPAGIIANPDKVQAILETQLPRSVKDVRRLTGKLAGLNRFLSRSGDRCAPFFKTLKKSQNFEWTLACQEAFDSLKTYLSSPPVLVSPKQGEPLFIYLGISDCAVSSVVVREEGGVQSPVYYISHALNDAETRYPRLDRLALALIVTARRLRPYFQAHVINIVTDQPLRQVLQRLDLSGRLVKWSIELSEYNLVFLPRTAIKAQILADFVAEFSPSCAPEEPVEEPESSKPISGQEIVPSGRLITEPWTLYTDGASGLSSSGVGVVLISPGGFIISYALKLSFDATNNQAEYESLLAGVRLCNELGIKVVNINCDSQLIVNQVNKTCETYNEILFLYNKLVLTELAGLDAFTLSHIPREQNEPADFLSKYGNPDATATRELLVPSINDKAVMKLDSVDCWYTPIVNFLTGGELPANSNEARSLRLKAARFFISGDSLFKKSPSGLSLRCLNPSDAQDVLYEIHSGECGSHTAGQTLAKRILRSGYYWPTLRLDADRYAKKCGSCQLYGPVLHLPAQPLQPVISAWPFAMWGMDFLGPFPQASGQRRFLLVMVDYFTKWIEARALTKTTTEAVISFLWSEIFARYGFPASIVTDNGAQFNNPKLIRFCEKNGVKLRFASVSHPQSNGQAEAANKSILNLLKKRLTERKGNWADDIPSVLWAHRTTPSMATGETPFFLAHGAEAVTPAELAVPTGRMMAAANLDLDQSRDWMLDNSRLLETCLDQLPESRHNALTRLTERKQILRRQLARRFKLRAFAVGDLVLRKLQAAGQSQFPGKFAPNWDGPFVIKEIRGPSAYVLQDSDGNSLPHTWNAADLKKFYA